MATIIVKSFFEDDTGSFSYIVADPYSHECAVIDPVIRYDPVRARLDITPARQLVQWIEENGYKLSWLLETHIHADHVSGATYLQRCLGGKTAIGSGVIKVLKSFIPLFNLQNYLPGDGSQFQQLLPDNTLLPLGEYSIKVLHTPGHTPSCVSYMIDGNLFVGDTLFMPDVGTARCDFPGGDACQLFHSIQRLYQLPDMTRLFVCHDYQTETRKKHCGESSIEEQKRGNIHLPAGRSEGEFVALRKARDKGLNLPRLMLVAVQLNLMAGNLPPATEQGRHYLNIPLNLF